MARSTGQARALREQALWRFRRHRNANLLATPGPHPFVIVLDHLKSDYNIGKIFRSADAFGAREVRLIGVEHFDPAPAMGSFKWVPAHFHRSFHSCHDALAAAGYTCFVMEPAAGEPLWSVTLPARSAFVVGHEEYGISFERSEFPDVRPLRIPQFGRVQSINVSVAASIVMYEYLRQHCQDSAGAGAC